jgi:hypothetical protein
LNKFERKTIHGHVCKLIIVARDEVEDARLERGEKRERKVEIRWGKKV